MARISSQTVVDTIRANGGRMFSGEIQEHLGIGAKALKASIQRARLRGERITMERIGNRWCCVLGGIGVRPPVSARMASLVVALRDSRPGGATTVQLAAKISVQPARCYELIAQLDRTGVLTRMRDGRETYWSMRDGADVRGAIDDAVDSLRSHDNHGRSVQVSPAAASWAESPPTQRIVPATEAPPLRKLGPAAVWELA